MLIYLNQVVYTIKKYVQISFDLNHDTDIENAIKDIRETSIANLQPNRKNQINVKTLSGISNWFN